MSSILDKPEVRRAALPLSVEQYHRLGVAGIIAANTELLRGVIVEKMIKSPAHTTTVLRLAELLRAALPAGLSLRQEQPLTLADSEPEPDLAVVEGGIADYREAHPGTARLVVEVAVASAELDRAKADLYAAAGIPEYWLVLPAERRVEVYREPAAGAYRAQRVAASPETLAAVACPGVTVELSGFFAP